eukprot:13644619-Ditylum_brightwellii.AAC.1
MATSAPQRQTLQRQQPPPPQMNSSTAVNIFLQINSYAPQMPSAALMYTVPTPNHMMVQTNAIFQPQPNMWQPQYTNTIKQFTNLNYCWTHSFDVGDGHHSHICQAPRYGQQFQTTRYNTMGDSTRHRSKSGKANHL